MEKSETSSNKAAPPPAPKTKAPPLNLLDLPIKSAQISQGDERSRISGEGEEREIAHPGPIDISKPEQAEWPFNLMKFAIAELKGELERDRYVEKPRSSQTFKIIFDDAKLRTILQETANVPTRETLRDMGKPHESYYACSIRRMDSYLW